MSATATKERAAETARKGSSGKAASKSLASSSKSASQGQRRGSTQSVAEATQPREKAGPNEMAQTKRGTRNQELGRKGEDAAERYLAHRGYEILERNWTCFAGEADIIAKDGCCLVFVEVKTRKNTDKGFPSEAVNAKKRERYERIALAYAAEFGEADMQVRFDVISIVVMSRDKAMIRHHLNAFTR